MTSPHVFHPPLPFPDKPHGQGFVTSKRQKSVSKNRALKKTPEKYFLYQKAIDFSPQWVIIPIKGENTKKEETSRR